MEPAPSDSLTVPVYVACHLPMCDVFCHDAAPNVRYRSACQVGWRIESHPCGVVASLAVGSRNPDPSSREHLYVQFRMAAHLQVWDTTRASTAHPNSSTDRGDTSTLRDLPGRLQLEGTHPQRACRTYGARDRVVQEGFEGEPATDHRSPQGRGVCDVACRCRIAGRTQHDTQPGWRMSGPSRGSLRLSPSSGECARVVLVKKCDRRQRSPSGLSGTAR